MFRHADVVCLCLPVAVLNAAFCMTCSLLTHLLDGYISANPKNLYILE